MRGRNGLTVALAVAGALGAPLLGPLPERRPGGELDVGPEHLLSGAERSKTPPLPPTVTCYERGGWMPAQRYLCPVHARAAARKAAPAYRPEPPRTRKF